MSKQNTITLDSKTYEANEGWSKYKERRAALPPEIGGAECLRLMSLGFILTVHTFTAKVEGPIQPDVTVLPNGMVCGNGMQGHDYSEVSLEEESFSINVAYLSPLFYSGYLLPIDGDGLATFTLSKRGLEQASRGKK